jgi:hypothetical protein
MAVAMAFPEPPKHERASSDLDLQRALYLSGLEVTLSGGNSNTGNGNGNASATAGYNSNYSSINTSYMFDNAFMMDVIPEQQHHQQQHLLYDRQQQQHRQREQQKMAYDKFWQGNSTTASTDDVSHEKNDNDLEQLLNKEHLDFISDDHPYLTLQSNVTTSTSQTSSSLAPPLPPPLNNTETFSRRGSTASSTGTPYSYHLKRLSTTSTTSSLRRQSSLTWMGGVGGVSINMLMDCYHEDFDALRSRGRIRISNIDTYQGRVPNSANGCTIIAPLLCIHHFHNNDNDNNDDNYDDDQVLPDPGLPDAVIMQVIDEETPNILPKVREELGLKKDAFIIPSDAHDCLMEQHYMCEEQFVSVCGGNVLDETHIQPLVDALKTCGPKKLAASFFFHEHVITILQLKRSATEVWYDVLDSLPHVETLSRLGEAAATATAQPVVRAEFSKSNYNNNRSNDNTQDWSTLFSSSGADTFPTTNGGGTFDTSRGWSSGSVTGGGLFDRRYNASSDRIVNYNNSTDGDDDDNNNEDVEGDGRDDDDDDDIVDQLPPELLLNDRQQQVQNAARIRCLDEECLKAALRWYACSVFTDENKAYIDTYKFDEKRVDFDPRVFQAFIWKEA